MAKRRSEKTKSAVSPQEAVEALRKNQRRLLDHPGVTSVGVGFRTVGGKRTDEVVIQCTVGQKLAPEALRERGIPPLPASVKLNGGKEVPIDVVERSFRPSHIVREERAPVIAEDFHEARRSFRDPMVPGISVSNVTGTAGTIGAFCFDRETGEPLLLSNWHVLHGPEGNVGDVIVQPGPYDDPDTSGNSCGSLLRSHLGFAGDCAVARIEARDWDREVLEVARIPRRMAEPELDDRVVKSGRTTGVTYGEVSRIDVIVKLDYGGDVGLQEVGGFEIRPVADKPPAQGEISQGGDSGSLWMIDVPADDPDADVAIGLHFAGETDPQPDAEHAVACKITSVADKLQITLEPLEEHEVAESALWREILFRLDRLEAQLEEEPPAESCSCGANGMLAAPPVDAGIPVGQVPEAGVPIYGNWCGPGHGGGQPIDAVDQACMNHDRCYDRRGYVDCDCDQALLRALDGLLTSSRITGRARSYAALIRGYFSASPCVRHIRVGGRTIPLPSRNTPLGGAISSAGRAASNARARAGRSVSNAGRRIRRSLGF